MLQFCNHYEESGRGDKPKPYTVHFNAVKESKTLSEEKSNSLFMLCFSKGSHKTDGH